MRTPRFITRVGLGLLFAVLVLGLLPASVFASGQADLRIIELNITGDEFIVIQNVGTAPAALSDYWLGYTSDNIGLAAPSQQLAQPSAGQFLLPGQTLALANRPQAACGASLAGPLPVSSLANSTGQLALWQLQSGGPVPVFTFLNTVSWGKQLKDSAGNLTYQPTLLISREDDVAAYESAQQPAITDAVTAWYFSALPNDAAQPPAWHVGFVQACQFTAVTSRAQARPAQAIDWLTDPDGPPFMRLTAVVLGGTKSLPSIPAADRGLKAPELSELLPNTAKPQTDAADEFIELYNPNSQRFDLSGFMLQTASATSSTVHTYHIPAGTTLAPGDFKAFTSAQTHLALNNGGGQVWLLDPLGHTVAKSDAYGKADDGLAWVNAAGKWQWTATPTPGATNKLATPIAASGASKTATVNGKKVTNVSSGGNVAGASTDGNDPAVEVSPIHPWVLAVVILAALLYGAYEYRHDLAARYHEFQRHRATRR